MGRELDDAARPGNPREGQARRDDPVGAARVRPALLRQYESYELGPDGYPPEWHRPSVLSVSGIRYTGTTAKLITPSNVASEAPAIKDLIRQEAEHRCLRCGHPYPPEIANEHPRGEWTPCDVDCTHGGPWRYAPFASDAHVVEAQWRILTVHHLDEDKANCRWWNLAALCQRCHLRMQRAVVMGRPYHFEHSAWFKPYAAGFYAWKYHGEDLEREETLTRLPELLALEHQFTQEALL